ncbi:hypothetical protein [Fimbriimonas ginsengisoli]|uniref:HAF repeat-containing protein n=1 Tax=Fimbriimonas ginsengisoli Gsoil 348 TaxID=661478 RepID=A0A068NUD8_FIMGI|nr:hypothetical protein [Fimbriimonas ginsengisoli]AIE85229.1 hypothetical protein OP10G_1861 [Fimbriimonas ginsengisoli Gsoil 348]
MIDSKDLLAAGAAADLVPLRFRLVELPPLPGDDSSKALALNAQGDCVGASFLKEIGNRPVRWGVQDRQAKSLLVPPSTTNATAHGISGVGEVVGSADVAGSTHPLRWDRAGSLTFLSESPESNGWAFGVNNAGRVVGDTPMSRSPRAAVWERDGSHLILPLPEGALMSEARAISGSGHVIGDALFAGKTRAVRWLPTGDTVVLNLPPGFVESAAIGISETLDVVGTVRDPQDSDTAAYWRTNGVVTVLGSLNGDGSSTALAVNSFGWVVGRSTTRSGAQSRAFFWTEGTGILDLASLVENAPGDFRLGAAHDINDAGQIVCEGSGNGSGRGYLLEPVYHVEKGRPY